MSTWMSRGGRFVVLAASLGVLAGCETLGNPVEIISGKVKAPDEFVVVARKPLKMPSSVRIQDLPEPTLGGASPLDPDPKADAAQALLGSSGTGAGRQTSAGEAALLGAAQAEVGQPVTAEALQAAEERIAESQEYESPSLFALIGVDGEPVEDALDADAEARRLQSQGVSTAPVNPKAEVPVE